MLKFFGSCTREMYLSVVLIKLSYFQERFQCVIVGFWQQWACREIVQIQIRERKSDKGNNYFRDSAIGQLHRHGWSTCISFLKIFCLCVVKSIFLWQGWEEGMLGMKKGGKRLIIVPSQLGYGDKGSKPKIPPGATLVFNVEVVRVCKITFIGKKEMCKCVREPQFCL